MTSHKRCTWVLAMALVASPALAQEELPGPVSDTIHVRLINMEAVVTDRHGVRVPDLSVDDFRLLVDGEETAIEFFTEVRGGDALSRPPTGPGRGGDGSATTWRDIPAVAPGESVGTSYLIFVDEFFTLDRDRDRVLTALTDELASLGPRDRVAVVAWDGRRLDVLSTWSQSAAALDRALAEARERPAFGLRRLLEKSRFDLGRFDSLGVRSRARGLDGALDPEERAYVQLLASQLEATLGAASSTLRSFAAPPGRKVMILLSGGWPFVPADFVAGDTGRPIYDGELPRGEALYRPLVDSANLLGYTLYPVDVPGLEGSHRADASRGAPAPVTTFADFFAETELHRSLQYLAHETGGRALLNGQRERPFSAVVADTRSFYWLGFTPTWVGDDAAHRVTLELVPPRLKVRSRSGFQEFSRERQASMAVESALLFGNPASPIPLTVEAGPAQRRGVGKMDVPLTLRFPTDAVALLPVGPEYVARLELRLAALDVHGGRSDVSVVPIEVRRDRLPVAGGSFDYETTVRLRRRPQDLVVSLYDQTSGAFLTATAQIGP